MKVIRTLKRFLILAFLAHVGITNAQTTLYVDGGSTHPHYKTLVAAIKKVKGNHSTYGDVTIEVSINTTETSYTALEADDNITIINPTSEAHSINWTTRTSTRLLGVTSNSVLNLGREVNGNQAALIFRAAGASNATSMSAGSMALFKIVGTATLNMYDNVELGFGHIGVWICGNNALSANNPTFNMYGGVIHSPKFACVHVQRGTFNMYNGYLVGHYNTSTTIPDFDLNPILQYSYVDNYFKNKYNTDEPILEEGDIEEFLMTYYNKDALSKLNRGMAVYMHHYTNATTNVFNFYDGVICGFCSSGGAEGHNIPTGNGSGAEFTYYVVDENIVFTWTPVIVNRSTANIYNGKLYGNWGYQNCGGLKLMNLTFNGNNVTPAYNEGFVTMRGGCLDYNSAIYGGGLRVESGTLFTMKGGSISHNVARRSNNTGGGGGGVRLVSAKFVMDSVAEIAYNHACGTSEAVNGGGIAGVWQASFGKAVCIAHLFGGRVHHNVAENNGGGVVATDKGNNTGNSGIEMLLKGVEIDHNTSKTSGGGVYVGGSSDMIIDKNPTTDSLTKIHDNIAYVNAGGIFVSSEMGSHIGSLDASNCKIYGNLANTGDGGGIYSTYCYVNIHSGADIYDHTITGKGAGICIAAQADYTQDGGTIRDNSADGNGGGFYITGGGNVTITGGTIDSNETQSNGGGFYVDGGTLSVSNANVTGNSASGDGGGFYSTVGVTVDHAYIANNQADNGGGFYVPTGITNIQNYSNLDGNTAANGGGLYLQSGTVNFTDATIQNNGATTGFGGGLYLGSGYLNLNGSSSAIKGNYAFNQGGGVYMGGGTFTMTGGTIGGTTAEGNHTTSAGSFGGGLYIASGTATVTNSAISGNYTCSLTSLDGCGGAIYMDGGSCTLSNGANLGGESANYANTSKYGGAIYSANGTIKVKGGTIGYNNAQKGGGIYSNGDNAKVYVEKDSAKADVLSYIQYNSAAEGGGIYANRGTVDFSDGYIRYNYASTAGGGIYVNDNGGADYGKLTMTGSAQLTRNYVPTGKHGGGVYLKGVITIGEQMDDPMDLGIILARDNFAHTLMGSETVETYMCDNSTRNNVYLPEPVVDPSYHKDVITVIEDGIRTDSQIGFSVPNNFVPVIYCINSGIPCIRPGYEGYTTSQYFLHQFSTGMEYDDNLFDDTHQYTAVHYADQPTVFDPDHVYLYGFWTNVVIEDPTGGHYEPGDIDTPEKLAYFISYVNGINDCAGDPHPGANGNITADIDMSQYGWVPIGEATQGYEGTLNGNGHTITGISSLLNGDHMAYGIIGHLDGGTVKNLFVKDAVYALEYKDDLVIGGLVGETSGNATIENSEVSCSMSASHPNTVMGGLVGRGGKVALETSSEWAVSDDYVPVNGVSADKYQKTEFIIPASQLTSMNGDYFSSMQFYLSTRMENGWGESSFLIFMKEVTSPELSGFSGTTGATVVYEGALSVTGTRLEVDFSETYHYLGGNLLIGVYETTSGTAEPASFFGCSSPNAAIHGESNTSLDAITSGTVISFMPKVLLGTSMQEVVTGNGTATNANLPINGAKVKSNFQKSEYIIPASELTALAGGKLVQMKLFLNATASSWGSAQRFKVYLKEVTNTTVGTSFTTSATLVFTGRLNCTSTTMTIDFTTPFEYHGGNLLVIIHETTRGDNNRTTNFVGVTTSGNVALHGESSNKLSSITTGTQYKFRPKTQFKAEEATSHQIICDGANTSHVIPVSGGSANKYQKNEFIVPATDLTAMSGTELTSMKFFLNTSASRNWGDATFRVFLKETTNTTMTGFTGSDDATVVYEGSLEAIGTTMLVNFMTPYTYGGGNLLVGIYQTGMGTAADAIFAGIEVDNASIHGEDATSLEAIISGTLQNMRPKTVFGYLPTAENTGTQTIHSSIAVADMSGYLMGGLVGQNLKGNFSNSFANAKFNYKGTSQYMGGLVAENKGTMESCYVRLRGNVPDENFGWLAGLNNPSGQLNYCYVPKNSATAPDPVYYASNLGNVKGCCYYLNDTETPYTYMRRDNQVALAGDVVNNNGNTNPYIPTKANSNPNPALPENNGDQQMLLCLNNWVSANGATTYTPWSRTTTKVINNDLPILKMNIVDGHNTPIVNAVYCTGNADGTENEGFLNYGEVNDMLLKADSVAIWLYQSKSGINSNKGGHANLYIDEGVTVIQSDSLYAYVGVTLDNSANINGPGPTFGDGPDYTDWHMFSTPLANAPLGVHYTDFDGTSWAQYGNSFSYTHPTGMPYYQFYNNEEAAMGDEDWERRGYFPSHRYGVSYTENNSGPTTGGNYYDEWDFYTYYEPEYHWINFKRNPNNHWHQNAETEQIDYPNETQLTRGRGYLLATRDEAFLQCHGLLNHGSVSIPVTYSGAYSPGYNFLGNPYQAYLDFDQFATINEVLWGGYSNASYAIIDEDEGGYIYHAINGSANPNTAPQFIAPHQGFMILAVPDIEDDATADFYPSMRDLNGDGGAFRGDINYPLVNLIATDGNGNRDIATVELGRPDKGGAPLMRELRLCNGHVWCHYEDKDWAIAFTQPGLTEAAIRFETFEDGEYTMRWNTQNGDFSYLHLIDNMTGADIDCLTTDEYRFTSSTMDYKSRFRLVFGYTGIEEPEGDDSAQGSFAYQSGDELVVTGEGTVELFDVTGRRMSAERIEGVQGTMSVSGLTPGVYLLRLNTATGTRVQKIVINQ